jgi:hypothetical protein
MLTRREWLSLTAAHAAAWAPVRLTPHAQNLNSRSGPHLLRPASARGRATSTGSPAQAAREDRIRRVVDAYSAQGFHRTATDVDRQSAEWLCEQVQEAGLVPAREAFALDRIDVIEASVVVEDRRLEAVPLFDGGFTDASGVRGRIGPLNAGTEIAVTEAAPNTAAAGSVGDARRKNRHRGIVCVTRGGRPGLCPSNADAFLNPFGPPAVQVSSDDVSALEDAARRGAEVQVIAYVRRSPAQALNVVASIAGADRSLPSLVVMTPRSGWWTCASERGGGIACWLELMRELRGSRREVLFVASSGHELGHLGVNAFVARRPGIVPKSVGWIHLGVNIGAAADPGNTLQASDDGFEALLAETMRAARLTVDRRAPRGAIPGGEAEAVHRGGGRYMSVIGGNGWFHNPGDRGADVVDAGVVSRFVDTFTSLAKTLGA